VKSIVDDLCSRKGVSLHDKDKKMGYGEPAYLGDPDILDFLYDIVCIAGT
jgi:hypothetical protein